MSDKLIRTTPPAWPSDEDDQSMSSYEKLQVSDKRTFIFFLFQVKIDVKT